MDASVSNFEALSRGIHEKIDAHNKRNNDRIASIYSKMENLVLKIDLLSNKFDESNAISPIVQRNTVRSSSVPTPEVGLDGPIHADHIMAMEQLQAGPTRGMIF